MSGLQVIEAGPGVLVQDQGRPGILVNGLSQGGAADKLALVEGAALLGQSPDLAALEMAGFGGVFEAAQDLRIALSGAPMRAAIDDAPVIWNASHLIRKGQRLAIGAATSGVYGYLHLGGGVASEPFLGSRSAHLTAGIGRAIEAGDTIPAGPDSGTRTGEVLDVEDRCSGGVLRVLPGAQTGLFSDADVARFDQLDYTRDARGNRQGVRLNCDADPFVAAAGLSVLSEVIVPGDIQITGDGAPFVLLAECQTTGGYPRIGSVIPQDLPRVAQAGPGARLRFEWIALEAALELHSRDLAHRKTLPRAVRPLIRDPHDIPDLLSYQLISGMIADTPEEEP